MMLAVKDTTLYTTWAIVAAIGVAIVLVVAVLLIAIWMTTRSIERHALRSLRAAQSIVENTRPIWALQETNHVAGLLRDEVAEIAGVGTALADALAPQPKGE